MVKKKMDRDKIDISKFIVYYEKNGKVLIDNRIAHQRYLKKMKKVWNESKNN